MSFSRRPPANVESARFRALVGAHRICRFCRLMPPENSEQARWFAECLRPHEAMLRAWLRAQFRSACDIDDIVQEAFIRVLRARESEAIDSPKAFLFATARNLVLMQLRHRQVEHADALAEMDESSILDESPDIPSAVARAQELELLTQAIQSLPTGAAR